MRRALAAVLLALPVRAAAEAGTVGGQTLQRPFGARALGMGEAFCAVPGGLDSAGYNPAGLSAAKRPTLGTSYNRGAIDDSFAYLGYAHPLPFAVLDAGLLYYDAGKIHLQLSDGTDTIVNAQQDYVGMLGAAVPLPFDFSIGALAKYYRFALAQTATAHGYAADAGAQWRSPLEGLTFGASIQNAGPDVKYSQEGDKLPLTERFGAAYLLDLARMGVIKDPMYTISRFLITADGVKRRDTPVSAAIGVEIGMPFSERGYAALRGGYVFNSDASASSFGFGVKEGRFLFDYALGVTKNLNNTQNIAIGVEF